MKCQRCGKNADKGWEYCPSCGFRLARTERRGSGFRFDNIFERFDKQMKQMQEMNKTFEKDFEVFDLSPMFRDIQKTPINKKTRGFRITMSSGTGMEPKISVKTFGDEKNDMRKDILEQLNDEKGIQIPMRSVPEERKEREKEKRFRFPGFSRSAERPKPVQQEEMSEERSELELPDRTEEPKTTVKRIDSRLLVDIDIPGVKSQDRINVRELENSIEVKAIADNKAYFKILTKPPQFRLSSKKFEKGKLHLEFS